MEKWVISYDDGSYGEQRVINSEFLTPEKAEEFLEDYLEMNPEENPDWYFVEKL